jgi:cob(I)alamin adenosyltransferase
MEKGRRFVHVYTGDGKGKTTAALGLTLRAAGAGWKVLFSQFVKRGEFSEIKALKRLGDLVTILQFGSGRFISGEPSPLETAAAVAGLEEVERRMMLGLYDMIVLDEINVAVHLGLLSNEQVIRFLDRRPDDMELVLTGRWAGNAVLERADVATEMRMLRHYYEKGVPAREGIEK